MASDNLYIHKGGGFEVETEQGTSFVPYAVSGELKEIGQTWEDGMEFADLADLMLYVEGFECERVERVTGYFGRWSLPGYLDSSSWHFDENKADLRATLEEYYGDNDE